MPPSKSTELVTRTWMKTALGWKDFVKEMKTTLTRASMEIPFVYSEPLAVWGEDERASMDFGGPAPSSEDLLDLRLRYYKEKESFTRMYISCKNMKRAIRDKMDRLDYERITRRMVAMKEDTDRHAAAMELFFDMNFPRIPVPKGQSPPQLPPEVVAALARQTASLESAEMCSRAAEHIRALLLEYDGDEADFGVKMIPNHTQTHSVEHFMPLPPLDGVKYNNLVLVSKGNAIGNSIEVLNVATGLYSRNFLGLSNSANLTYFKRSKVRFLSAAMAPISKQLFVVFSEEFNGAKHMTVASFKLLIEENDGTNALVATRFFDLGKEAAPMAVPAIDNEALMRVWVRFECRKSTAPGISGCGRIAIAAFDGQEERLFVTLAGRRHEANVIRSFPTRWRSSEWHAIGRRHMMMLASKRKVWKDNGRKISTGIRQIVRGPFLKASFYNTESNKEDTPVRQYHLSILGRLQPEDAMTLFHITVSEYSNGEVRARSVDADQAIIGKLYGRGEIVDYTVDGDGRGALLALMNRDTVDMMYTVVPELDTTAIRGATIDSRTISFVGDRAAASALHDDVPLQEYFQSLAMGLFFKSNTMAAVAMTADTRYNCTPLFHAALPGEWLEVEHNQRLTQGTGHAS